MKNLVIKYTQLIFELQSVTNEEVTLEELGGAHIHTTISGVAHKSFKNDVDALLQIRTFLSFLPQSNRDEVPIKICDDTWYKAIIIIKTDIDSFCIDV